MKNLQRLVTLPFAFTGIFLLTYLIYRWAYWLMGAAGAGHEFAEFSACVIGGVTWTAMVANVVREMLDW